MLYAGESCHLINDIKPAAQIVHDMMREAAVPSVMFYKVKAKGKKGKVP